MLGHDKVRISNLGNVMTTARVTSRLFQSTLGSCEDKLKGKSAPFRFPSASQKRACFEITEVKNCQYCGWLLDDR